MKVKWITAFVDRGSGRFEATADFWSIISGSSLSAWRGGDDEFATLLPSDGADAHLRVQRTRSGFSGSHIDLHVSDVRASTAECVSLGATIVTDNGGFVVLATPGGMAFCIVAHHGEHRRQQPVDTVSSATTTLIDQVSIDCDPDLFDAEVAFWSSITGWAPLAARAKEFVPLDRPSGMPLRVMLQLRSTSTGRTSCHLDLACDDVATAVDEHGKDGASQIQRHDYWTVMTDPSGAPYRLTSRLPSTGQLGPQAGYVTVEELKAAKAALIESMPGWTPPAAYAVGVSSEHGQVEWTYTNHRGIHGFPAVALSKVLGHRSGSASFVMDLKTFDDVIDVLRPAGTCKHYEHPNLWAWEGLRVTIDADGGLVEGRQIVAVLIGDETDPAIDGLDQQLRAELGID